MNTRWSFVYLVASLIVPVAASGRARAQNNMCTTGACVLTCNTTTIGVGRT